MDGAGSTVRYLTRATPYVRPVAVGKLPMTVSTALTTLVGTWASAYVTSTGQERRATYTKVLVMSGALDVQDLVSMTAWFAFQMQLRYMELVCVTKGTQDVTVAIGLVHVRQSA